MITSVEQMVDQYLAAWNENNLEAYKREFAKCVADDFLYSDPFGEYEGVNGLANFANISLDIIPARKFTLLEKPEHHHTYGRYAWKVEFSGKTNIGYDYFEFNQDFKMTSLISFFKLPEDYPLDKLG